MRCRCLAPGTPRRLFEYIGEQLKQVEPKAFQLSKQQAFLRRRRDLAGLPGVEFDVQGEGDHVWLRVRRLTATQNPPLPEQYGALFARVRPERPATQPQRGAARAPLCDRGHP